MTEVLKMANMTGLISEQPSTDALERARVKCELLCECENAMPGTLDKLDGYNCEKCKNKGYVLKPRRYLSGYEETQIECDCRRQRKSIRDFKRSGLADVMLNYSFEKYEAKEPWQIGVLSKAKAYVKDEGTPWFFFGGNSGAGKTHICTAIAVELLQKKKEVKYMLWRDEVRKLKATVNEKDCEIDIYKDVEVLYIDDLFKTGKSELGKRVPIPTQGDINVAFEIINSRYLSQKRTIISTELSIEELLDIDVALGSRIKQMCGEYCLNLPHDLRKNYRLSRKGG